MNKEKLIKQLERHEGLRLKPYKDTVGKLTIGIGRNLDDRGITHSEARTMLLNDIEAFESELQEKLPLYSKLDDARQNVLLNMAFNLGVNGLMTFRNMLAFIELGDFELAADEILDSKYARQVGQRAIELSKQLASGEYENN